ncbi:MAG: GPW/gp25 family protein [Saprospiraceae bacterium]|nr:GPW/gp25 family protein [Saprospiraceae bacterium]
MTDNQSFLGRGWAFPPELVKTSQYGGEVMMAESRADIEQSLGILLRTSVGERVLQPTYGCNMSDYLFSPMSATMLGFLRDMVFDAILYHEPRIKVEKLDVTESDSLDAIEGRLIFEIDYIIRGTNSRFNFVYDYYLTEATRI